MSRNNRLDMGNPIIKSVARHMQHIGHIALDETLVIEKSVNSIFLTIKKPNKPEQIASGVFVCIKDQYFVFSASHVFDHYGQRQLLMAVEGEEMLVSFAGERFSSAKGPSGTHKDDPIDASVFHIQTEVPESVKALALSISQLDREPYDKGHSVFVISGIRSKKSKTIGNQSYTERESYFSVELSNKEYDNLCLSKDYHLVLAYDDEIHVNGQWQISPTPAGFSGGGIFRIDGLSKSALFLRPNNLTPLLTAITIEQRRGKNGNVGVLVGTRIGVHLGLIQKFLPEVFL